MTRPGGRTRWRRRVILHAVLSLMLGFITTWAVAWACGVYVAPGWDASDKSDSSCGPSEPAVYLTHSHKPGVDHALVTFFRWEDNQISSAWLKSLDFAPAWTRTCGLWQQAKAMPPGAVEMVTPGCGTFGDLSPALYNSMWSEALYGWPRPCLSCSWPGGQFVRDALIPPRWLRITSERGRFAVLPYRPYWPALIFNSFFYAALWPLLLVAPRATRRVYRHLRRCRPRCGYDIRHGDTPGCPECGWGRGERAAVHD